MTPTKGAPLLKMQGIVKEFPGVRALSNLTFDVYKGECHCLVGENGAGKSTLMKILSGAYTPTSGIIHFDGHDYKHLTPALSKSLGIEIVYQENDLVPTMNAIENIFVGKEMISFVIGTKGARINQIKKNSNATLRVLRDEMVLISGAPEAIAKAAELLETALEEYKATHVTLTVEEELLNSVRGVRNSNILAIQREYNVRINVDRSGLISIQGTDKEMVEKASMDLNESIEKARENPEIISRPMREVRPRRVVEEKKEEVSAAGLWERLKQAPLLPSLGKTVGGSESYK